jgi:hypothetical protein
MAEVERKSAKKLEEYLQTYCKPLSRDEEFALDTEVLQMTANAMPEEMGMTYEELFDQAEQVRHNDDAPLPIWFWYTWLYGSKASETLKEHKDLEEKVLKFTHLFGDLLPKAVNERGLVYGTWVIGPFGIIQAGNPSPSRLFRLKDPVNTPEEVLKSLGAERPKLVTLGTNKLFAHQQRYIASKKPLLAEPLKLRRNGKQMELAIRSSLELPRGMAVPSAEDVLQRMQTTLLKRKANGASLLKTHLYLIDRAYRAGGEEPRFEVDLDDLLEAKGYKRQSYGDFHPDTYREEYGRIVTLGASWITLWEVKVKGKDKRREKYVDQTPYWELRARRKLEEGDLLGLQPVLLAHPFAPIIKAVLMEPGLWWRVSKVGDERIQIPRAILALPTDGKGNEAERIAVQLAATLAIWIRAGQSQHAGKACNYSVGALLEASGITTRDEFMTLHVEQAKRLRRYLAGDDGTDGALATLRNIGAFGIDIADEKAFWASGRGWTEKFWEAHLAVEIPNLGIMKARRKNS